MKTVFDQLAKELVQAALRDVARLESGHEIAGHALVADLWVEPLIPPDATPVVGDAVGRDRLGALGRMLALGPCLIEPFSRTPTVVDIRSCILKQYSLAHAQRRDARGRDERAPPFPRLWVISIGRPNKVIESMRLSPMPDWPEGFYRNRPFDPFHLVVIRQLPRTPDTLLFRLLGRGVTFREAVEELLQTPADAPDTALLVRRMMHVLVVFGEVSEQHRLEEHDMPALQDIEAAYSKWERRVKAEGRAEGKLEGRAEGELEGRAKGLLLALELANYPVSRRLREHILGCTDSATLDTWYARIRTARALGDIFAADVLQPE